MTRKWWTLIAVSIATFMLLLDITVVNTALPSIREDLGASFADLQWVVDAYVLTLAAVVLTAGSLADRIGRKPLLLACCIAYIVVPYPVFSYLLSGASYGALIAIQIFFALLISMFSGAGPAAIAEIFPTRSRSTWMTSGYALAVAIFGGFAPAISIGLIDYFQSPLAHTFYLIAAAVISGIVIATLPETAHRDLD